MCGDRDEYEEKLFERYVKEVLEKNEVDPLEYCYYRESIDFQCYMVRETIEIIGEELVKPIETVFKKLFGK